MNETITSASSQIVYEFNRGSALEGWWLWALLITAIVVIVYLCLWLYRRDVHELPQGIRWTLMAMRLTTIAALIFFFFDLQRRTQRSVTRPSEVVILVDTSQSMSLPGGQSSTSPSRVEQATALISSSGLVDQLTAEHRTSVYAFDSEPELRLLETRSSGVAPEVTAQTETATVARPGSGPSDPIAMFGLVCIGAAVLLSVGTLMIGAAGRGANIGWLLFACGVCLVMGIVSLGGVYAIATEKSLSEIIGAEGILGDHSGAGSDAVPAVNSVDEPTGDEPA